MDSPSSRGTRPLSFLAAFLVALAGLVAIATPAHAADEVTHVGVFPPASSGTPTVDRSWALDIGPNGDLFVADGAAIRQFTPAGELVRSVDAREIGAVYGVEVTGDGTIYAAGGAGIAKFRADGTHVATFPSNWGPTTDLAVAPDGSIYVMAWGGREVRKLDAAGALVSQFSAAPGGSYGLALDRDGFLWVPDFGGHELRKYTQDGVPVATITESADGRRLSYPFKVDTTVNGDVALGEYGAAGFTVYAADGSVRASLVRAPGFSNVFGIAIDDDGRIFVSDQNNAPGIHQFSLGPVFAAFTPQITGSGRVGDELTVTASTTPEPASWTYAWTVAGSDEIRSTAATFTPIAADRGRTATVTVTAKGTDGEPADRRATATKAITGRLMEPSAFTITDSTPDSGPTRLDLLTVTVDEALLPRDAAGSVRWGRIANEECVVPEDAPDSRTYRVTNADAGATLCAVVSFAAAGHEDLTTTLSAASPARGSFVSAGVVMDDEWPVVGQTVEAVLAVEEEPAGTQIKAVQWGRYDRTADECVAIEGATERTYTVEVSDFATSLCLTATVGAPHYDDVTGTMIAGQVAAGVFPQAPTVTLGDWAQVGQESRADVSGGDPADADRAYQWSLDGEPIDGATQATYTPKGGDRGKSLSVTVTSTSRGYVADETTSNAVEVASGRLSVPEPAFSTDRPAVGTPVSLPLDLTDAPEGAAGHWQWGLWDDEAETCVATDGATTDTVTPTPDQLGEVLCAVVGVTAPGYGSLEATFVAETSVTRGTLPTIRAVLSSTTPKVGSTLTVALLAGALPAGTTTTVTWGQAVAGADCRPAKAAGAYRVTADTVGRTVCALVTVSAPGHTEFSTVLKTAVVKEAAKVAPSRKVVRGTDAFAVRAQGLAPGQRYRISIRHRMFTGTADSHGRVVRTVRYGKGLKSGKRTVIVRGFTGTKVTYTKRFTITYRAR
ncbi:NHL repeat-containing protein [Aeromicrobium sp. 179-A 4D2 NHS]|uniref:NHL repeat-containing protein n=1 Tax=Aeromicrobium sp. 179-A 4D2 NHS TaxID=3142375 RepID=UPI00399F96D7